MLVLLLAPSQAVWAQSGSSLTSGEKGVASPRGKKFAFLRVNEKNEKIPFILRIEDRKAGKTSEFLLLDQDGNACASVLDMVWLNEDTLGLECHINPSLSNYLLINSASGKCQKHYYGYNFCWSPDGKVLAHVGAIPHFAPAESKSEYLQFNDKTVYPRPGKPVYKKKEIHSFAGAFVWSPDSARVAFLDSIDEKKSVSLVVVSRDGAVTIKPLGIPLSETVEIHWNHDSNGNSQSLTLQTSTKRQLLLKLPR
jgi:hypothetical protein